MNPHIKLRIANSLMFLGLLPLVAGCYAMVSTLASTDYQQQSQIGLAFIAIGKAVMAWVFALVVSGAGVLWSAQVEKRHAGAQARPARMLRTLVFVMLLLPLALLIVARL
jgi:hypothetical protein